MSLDKIIASIPGKTEADRAKMRANAERLLTSGTPAQKADAQKLLDALNAHVETEREKLNDLLSKTPTLTQQAGHNSKEQFSNSPALKQAIVDAVIDALDAHSTMSKQALDSERVREGLKDVLLGPGQLYEALRNKGGFSAGASGR